MLALIQEKYPNDVRIIYRHFPLISIHDKAALSMQAAEAAGLQDEFWEMHDALFERQAEWSPLSVEQFDQWLLDLAAELNLDQEAFYRDLHSEDLVAAAQSAWDAGRETGMPGTPFLLKNGEIWPNGLPMSFGNISGIIDLEFLERRQFSECPPMKIDVSNQYIATITTEQGDIVVELFADKTPIAVNNFVFLAESGWYDGVTFHRVLADFMAQAGDPSGTGMGGPGYAFINEVLPDLRFNEAGLVAMANSGPDTNGSQFFITTAPAPHLDGGFTIFGRVIQGLDVVRSLALRDPSQGFDLPPGDMILSVKIERK